MFSLVPLIVICIAVAGLFFGKEAVQGELIKQIYHTLGSDSARQIKSMITKAMNKETSIVNQIIGAIVLIFGASGVFDALQKGLNAIWHVKPKSDRGLMEIIKDRFLSFTMVLGVSFLLLVSLVISVVIAITSNYINTFIAGGDIIGLILNSVVSAAIITLLFAMIFKYLPDIEIKFADVLLGAFITTILFTVGKFLLSIYFKYSNTGVEFGTGRSLIVMLVWVFYSANIFFLGAEFTKTYATRKGKAITPSKNAVLVTTRNIKP